MNTLLQGNCFDLMKSIPDGSVDLVLTDPPYNNTDCEWDAVKCDFPRLFNELLRVLKPNGALLMFCQMPLAAELVMMQRKIFRYQWVWEKSRACGFANANKMPMRAHEIILTFYRKLPTYNRVPLENQAGKAYSITRTKHYESEVYRCYKNGKTKTEHTPYHTENDGNRAPRDVIYFDSEFYTKSRDEVTHPTRKPQALCEYLIKQYSQPGELVLDPFCGSGTTAAAALATGRRYWTCELEDKYFDLASKRLAQLEADMANPLFSPDSNPELKEQLTFDL